MRDLELTGLDGSNPLGFLAALGTLAVLEDCGDHPSLRWESHGRWTPVVGTHLERNAVLDACFASVANWQTSPVLQFEYGGVRDLKPPPDKCRDWLKSLVERDGREVEAQLRLACALVNDAAVARTGDTKPTALHFTAGQQRFLASVLELADSVQRDDFDEALFGPWSYERTGKPLGWDASRYRDYALLRTNPAKEGDRGTIRGADWLALLGLRFLPVFAKGDFLLTTGCDGGWKDGSLCWPLWDGAVSADGAATVLRQDWQSLTPPHRVRRGVPMVFRAAIKRSDQGGYGSFAPATPV